MASNPKTEATAFLIWAYAKPRGWNVTCQEVADAIGTTHQHVNSVLIVKGWSSRIRVTKKDCGEQNPYMFNIGFASHTMGMR